MRLRPLHDHVLVKWLEEHKQIQGGVIDEPQISARAV